MRTHPLILTVFGLVLFEEVISENENKEWVAENFDQLLSSCKSAENAHKLLKAVIGTKNDSSPAEDIRLSKELLRKENGEIDFPGGLGEASAKAGWATLFEYYYLGLGDIDRLVPVLVQLGHSEQEVRAALEKD